MNRTTHITMPMKLFTIFGLIVILSSSFAGGNVSMVRAQNPTLPAPDGAIQPLADNGSSLYYYVDGKRFDLTPSLDWVSVKFVSADALEQESVTGKFSSTVVSLDGAREIPHLGLALLPLKDGLGEKSLIQGVNSMRASTASFSQVNPVYTYDGVDMVVSDEFIATFPPSSSESEIETINAAHGVEVVSSILGQENTFVLRVTSASGLDALAMANLYQESGLALSSAPNFVRLMAADTVPNKETLTSVSPMFVPDDPYYAPDQWYLNNTGQHGATIDADIDAPEAWNITKGSTDVVIAIIDEGVDLTHQDFSSKLVPGYDATGQGTAGGQAPSSNDWHGTAAAGIAAADSNNTQGISGVCQLCRIMPVRVAYSDGTAAHNWITQDSWLANGITWAYTNLADVLNNSWVGGLPVTVVNTAISNAVTLGRETSIGAGDGTGAVVVFSAGSSNNSNVSWPASLSNVISVGSLNKCDQRKNPNDTACGNNEGWGSNFGPELDVMAAGVLLATTDIMGDFGASNSSTVYFGADYTDIEMKGTSGAAPIVSGIVGLMLSINPYMTPVHVQEVLQATADNLGASGRDDDTGYGRANAFAAVAAAKKPDLIITGYQLLASDGTTIITAPDPNEKFYIRVITKNRGGTTSAAFYPSVYLDDEFNYEFGKITSFDSQFDADSDFLITAPDNPSGYGCVYYDPNRIFNPSDPGVSSEVNWGNYPRPDFNNPLVANAVTPALIPNNPDNSESVVPITYTDGAIIHDGLGVGVHKMYLYVDPTCTTLEGFENNNALGPITVNVGVAGAVIDVNIAGVTEGNYELFGKDSTRQSYPGKNNGPTQVISSTGSLIDSMRVLFGGVSYSEMMGYPADKLTNNYWFPYYNNTAMNSQLRVSNVGGVPTTITVTYGNNIPLDSYTLGAGEATRINYPGINSGPLHVTSSASNILTTIRVLFGGLSYSELMGFPNNQLTNNYWFPYYNNTAMNSQLRVSNVGGASTTITVTYGNNIPLDSYTLAAGEATRKEYPGINSGPLHVTSSASNILTTIRVLFGSRSFSEISGFPANQLTTEYWYPVYDNVNADSQLRISNVGGAPTTISVYGANNTLIDTYSLAVGAATRLNYAGVNNGPLHVVSSASTILSTQRLLYTTSTFGSFYELTGFPGDQLTTNYYFPWYNNTAMNSQLRMAAP